jgi:hypothetical protein
MACLRRGAQRCSFIPDRCALHDRGRARTMCPGEVVDVTEPSVDRSSGDGSAAAAALVARRRDLFEQATHIAGQLLDRPARSSLKFPRITGTSVSREIGAVCGVPNLHKRP